MTTRRRITWLVYAACLALLVQGLAWVSWQVVRLESRERAARVLNEQREGERLALWRMDSLVAPVIAQESARPYFHYRAFVPAGRAYEAVWQPAPDGAPMAASPLLTDPADEASGRLVRLHVLIDPDGRVTSPQAPTDAEVAAAGVPPIDYARVDRAAEQLDLLAALIATGSRETVALEGAPPAPPAPAIDQAFSRDADRSLQEYAVRSQIADLVNRPPQSRAEPGARDAGSQPAPVAADFADELPQAAEFEGRELAAPSAARSADAPPSIRVGAFVPAWLGPELVLFRDVVVDAVGYRQGVWLDWPALRTELLTVQGDLFAGSSLEPIDPGAPPPDPEDAARRLATIPVVYLPGHAPAAPLALMTPARWSLVVSWVAVIAAAVAIGLVLHASIQLSERRGRFVSAVTHELRTPLTTFRLYAQMLADGMVRDEGASSEYLATLKRESSRLSGIVENVLEYARLSRRATGRPRAIGPVRPEDLLVRLRPELSRRAEQGGMDLIVSSSLDPADRRVVHVDPQSVERVLTNLVDNACKYAGADADDADTRVHLDVSARDGELELLVADHGPGVPAADRARIFGEFRRGAAGERADRSGLGLGLALSRGLAREAGGDLRLVRRRGHGAEFLLTLPLTDPAP